ncbi:MAG TPA: Asp-tRNA(Asn)/Glu-tRNA(Gln) amidotransferase subunit GatB [Actinomycetota bacterium]|jgi:aspartyl-tRNA(Asn)/glutamyl-tRNA(Gln) amidotransferase subunit B
MAGWETVIGLECHVELSTRTKMFCGCRNEFGAPPNTNVCPVCLGQPGSLPVPNEEAIRRIVRIGLALDSEIAPHSLFHRKNYFYPDMPKNYQISQYDLPICVGGHLDVQLPSGEVKRVGITRVHMEEDTGKTSHVSASGRIHEAEHALVDYNRAGVPLVECVSEPDLRSPEEAAAYLRELRAILEALDVSDVRMEEGSLRCDANVSVRPAGSTELGTKVEIKNMNSIRSLERALVFERDRQIVALEAGQPLVQETRHWDEDSGSTKSMRSKEEAFDYRYFPEPDIPPIEPARAWVEELRASLPELPRARRERLGETLSAPELELEPAVIAGLLSSDRAETFIDVQRRSPEVGSRLIASFVLNEPEAAELSDVIVEILGFVHGERLSASKGKEVLEEVKGSGRSPVEIIDERDWWQVSDADALGAIADEVIAENPEVVEKFLAGKDAVIGFLVGQVVKKSGGSANPTLARQLLQERLSR